MQTQATEQTLATGRIYATDRAETEACECGTSGCPIDHTAEGGDTPCTTW